MKTQKRETLVKKSEEKEAISIEAQLLDCVNTYLKDIKEISDTPELEVRIGGYPFITKTNFDNVVKKILSIGFTTDNMLGMNLLRINVTDQFDSQYRAEIRDFNAIQNYCIHENIQRITSEYNSHIIRFEQK